MTDRKSGLATIADANGVFSIVAMDQRNTLRRMFAAVGQPDATDDDIRLAKVDVAAALTPLASAILLDPSYGVPAVVWDATSKGAQAYTALAGEVLEREGVRP